MQIRKQAVPGQLELGGSLRQTSLSQLDIMHLTGPTKKAGLPRSKLTLDTTVKPQPMTLNQPYNSGKEAKLPHLQSGLEAKA